jgi:hypothetical protein
VSRVPATLLAAVTAAGGVAALGFAGALPTGVTEAVGAKSTLITSAKIKNGTVKLEDLSASLRKRLTAKGGTATTSASQGPAGPVGPQGPTGPPGPFTGTLPSGATMRGTVAANGSAAAAGQYIYGAISFPFSTAAALTPRYISLEGTPPPECPGTSGGPQARPGFLCVFEVQRTSSSGKIGTRRVTEAVVAADPTRTSTFGAMLEIRAADPANLSVTANWAATAP